MKITAYRESWPLRDVFRIAHSERYYAELVICKIEEDGIIGYGEAYPYMRYGESPDSVIKQIEVAIADIKKITSSNDIEKILPGGAARSAVDLAYWDLKAKKSGRSIWEISGLKKPNPICSAYTICVDNIEKIGNDSLKHQNKKILKLKLSGDGLDAKRIQIVSKNAPNARLVIDANESWDERKYQQLIETCKECNVEMIEQPFKAGNDSFLASIKREIPICADESCHTSKDLTSLVGKYDIVNIKLEKAGGLTEALKLKQKARMMGFKIMVGCMVSTSRSIRPAYYLSQDVEFADLDGFALLLRDRENGLRFSNSMVSE